MGKMFTLRVERLMIFTPCRDYGLNEFFETNLPGVLARELVMVYSVIHSDKSLLRGHKAKHAGRAKNKEGRIRIAERRDILVIFTI